MTRLEDAIASLLEHPTRRLVIEIDPDPREPPDSDDGGPTLSACLFERCPPDGWPTRGDYFGQPDRVDAKDTEFPWKHDDRVIAGVNSPDPKAFMRLLADMIERDRT